MFRLQNSSLTELDRIVSDPEQLGSALMEEFGVPLRLLQDKVKIEAIKDPVKFMDDRDKEVKKLFKKDGAVTKIYQDQLKVYKDLGLPPAEAMQLAGSATRKIYENTLAGYDLKYSDAYSSAFGVANASNVTQLAKAEIADDSIIKDKGYYKKKYKSKYDNKLQKQLAK